MDWCNIQFESIIIEFVYPSYHVAQSTTQVYVIMWYCPVAKTILILPCGHCNSVNHTTHDYKLLGYRMFSYDVAGHETLSQISSQSDVPVNFKNSESLNMALFT